MCEKKLVFSYCGGAYCTQICNIFHEELSPRPSGLSVSKILLHEHLLYNGVLYVIFGISNKPNNVLSSGLLFDQKWVGLFESRCFGRGHLNGFFLGLFFLQVSPCLRWFVGTIATEMPLFFASETSSFLTEFLLFVVIKGWMRISGASFNPTWCSIHRIVPLLLEGLLPLFRCWAGLTLPFVVELGLDPHVLCVMLNSPPFPIRKGIWIVELGHVNGQRGRKSFNEHIYNRSVIEIVSSEVGESFESTDIVVKSLIAFHFEGLDVGLGVHGSSNIGKRAEKRV